MIITGAAAGIGREVARQMVGAGGRVLLVDRNPGVEEVAAQIGDGAASLVADLTEAAAAERIRDAAQSAHGAIDVLVNNAGRYPFAMLAETSDQLVEDVFGLNFTAALRLTRTIVPVMTAGASVINVGSLDGLRPSALGLTVYGASKAALLAMTKHLALELAPSGIRVNAVVPGGIRTEGAEAMSEGGAMTVEERDAIFAAFSAKTPMGRMGIPDDLAGPVVFLASNDSAYVTGSVLLVDGGLILAS